MEKRSTRNKKMLVYSTKCVVAASVQFAATAATLSLSLSLLLSLSHLTHYSSLQPPKRTQTRSLCYGTPACRLPLSPLLFQQSTRTRLTLHVGCRRTASATDWKRDYQRILLGLCSYWPALRPCGDARSASGGVPSGLSTPRAAICLLAWYVREHSAVVEWWPRRAVLCCAWAASCHFACSRSCT